MSWLWPSSPGAAQRVASAKCPAGERRVAHFGPFQLDTLTEELWNAGRRIRLQSQPFRILVLLLGNPNELVTREDIRRALWNEETSVGFDNSINASMNKLRAALEDSAQTPRYVETLSRRG